MFDNKPDHMHWEKVNNIADYIVQLIQRRYTRPTATAPSPKGKAFGIAPSTGSMCSILVILAAVLLITKRRMNAED